MSFAVIIPSRNRDNLIPCMKALQASESGQRVFIAWDRSRGNPSLVADDSYSVFLEGHAVTHNCCYEDFNFSRNINAVLKGLLVNYGYDGFVILGDDGLLQTPGGFSLLAEECRKDPSIGVIGCTTNLGHRCQKPRGVGLRFVEHFAFVAVYIPRTTIEKVGLLDERFNTYGWEDNDYTHRVRLAGLKCAVHDGCYVDHGSLVSTFRGDPKNPAELASGRAIFEAKWPGVPQ